MTTNILTKNQPTQKQKLAAMVTKQHTKSAAAIVFILSLAGISLWLFEILKIKGWYGLSWLNGQLYSPYIATIIAVFSFMTPFIVIKQIAIKKIILPTIILYTVSILCFEAGKGLCYMLYWRFCCSKADIWRFVLFASILFTIVGVAYWYVTNKLIKRNKKRNMLYITLVTFSAMPLSILTIHINSGFGSDTDWVDIVKMGYPIFWTTIMLGLSGIIIARQQYYA